MTLLELAYVALGVVSALVVFCGTITLAVLENRRRFQNPPDGPNDALQRESHHS